MKHDILDELARGKISPKEAQRIHDEALAAGTIGLGEGLGMSNAEYTAHCHGVWFNELAKWRQNGWPTTCAACGKSIDVSKFGWMAREAGRHKHVLEHIECPVIPGVHKR